jgi:ribonuclease R
VKNEVLTGVMHKHRKGFGFVTPDGGDPGCDIFIRSDHMSGAMDGDTVVVDYRPHSGRGDSPEGKVRKIVGRAVTEYVGTFDKDGGAGYVVSGDRHQTDDLYISPDHFGGAKDGDLVAAKITAYPQRGRGPEGVITEIIARKGETGGDIKALIRQYNVSEEFPEQVLKEAEEAERRGITDADIEGRTDLRQSRRIFTIDGADSKDFDDAVSVEMTPAGHYLLGVHIADVSHYVAGGSALDKEAAARGNSIYLADRVIPMLPEALSNGICSLNPDEDRLTLSVDMEIDKNGNVVNHRIYESVIRSCERLVYDDISDILENGDKALIRKYDRIYGDLLKMRELAELLERKKDERGSIDFELSEPVIKMDENGHVASVAPADRRTANKMIEQFMLLANETVAHEYFGKNVPFVYRVHEKPEKEKMEDLEAFLKILGMRLGGDIDHVTPKMMSDILKKAEGKPYENVVNSVVLRSMQKAAYDTKCRGHFGLALRFYCHFTSPIRRYPDLIIHRIIKACLHGEHLPERETRDAVRKAARHSSETERAAIDLERDVAKIKMGEYMAGFIGERYDGVISGVTGFGIFVELPNTVEGLVRINELSDDYYVYEPEKYRLIGKRRRRTYDLGDPVRVEVESVDEGTGEINFRIVN